MKNAYVRQYNELTSRHWWWISRRGLILRLVNQIAVRQSVKEILDIGCAGGQMLQELVALARVTGVEPDANLAEQAARHEEFHLIPESIETAPLETNRYDLALALDVIEHIENDLGALQKIYRALKPGGRLILTVPALATLWSEHDVANKHFRRYEKNQLIEVLSRAGFKVELCRFFFFWTVPPFLLRHWICRADPTDSVKAEQYEVKIPPAPINAILTALSSLEHRLAMAVPLPFGTSLLAIAVKGG
jgi:SAM-dependent methyltransferase